MLRTQLPLVCMPCRPTLASSAISVGNALELDPVELDVLPRGEMAVAAVVAPADMRQACAAASEDKRAVGDCDPQHVGVQLKIEAVHQPQRLELLLGQFAGQAAADLIAQFGDAFRHQSPVEFVIGVHVSFPVGPATRWWGRYGGCVRASSQVLGVRQGQAGPVPHRRRPRWYRPPPRRQAGRSPPAPYVDHGSLLKPRRPGAIRGAINHRAITEPIGGDDDRTGDLELLLMRRCHAAVFPDGPAMAGRFYGRYRYPIKPAQLMRGISPVARRLAVSICVSGRSRPHRRHFPH